LGRLESSRRQDRNVFGSIVALTRKRSVVVSSTVPGPTARRRRKGHFHAVDLAIIGEEQV
jgi:hypothetical protein